MAKSRAPIVLPGYALGDDARPDHFTAAIARETAALEAKELEVGDAAFILRSGHKWAYAVVIEKGEKAGDGTTLRFEVDAGKNRKTFPEAVWGKYIRVIKADASEMAKLEAEAGAADHAPKQEAKKGASKSPTLVLGEFSSEVGSWFSSKWGSKTTADDTPDAAEKKKNTSGSVPGSVPVSLSLESAKASSSQEDKPAVVTASSQEDKPVLVASKGATIPPQIGALLSSFSTSVSSICGQLKGKETALCNALNNEEDKVADPKSAAVAVEEKSEQNPESEEPTAAFKDEEGKAATIATEEKGGPEPESGEPKAELAAAAAEETDESKIESAESKTTPRDEGEVATPEPADATEEKSEPTPESEDAKIEKGESAESETTATKTKEKSKLGSRISSMVGKVSGGLKPKKKDKAKAAAVATTEETTQIDDSELAKTKTEESEAATPVASPDAAYEENTSSLARAPAPVEAPGAGAQKPAPVLDETRDATEDMPSLVPTSSDSSARKSPSEGTTTPALPGPVADPPASPAPVMEPPAPEPEPPKPIKLLKTPFKFYKARSMKEDPAAAALAATSFADDPGGYGVIQSHGVAVCNHDPAAAVNANILAQERVGGRPEIPQDDLIKQHNAELKRQGVAIIETE